ncbi:MAG: hypothetical protein WKF38_05870, partial [Candidatus Limnocylindrales bacterium]
GGVLAGREGGNRHSRCQQGVAFIPGPAFSPGGHFHDALRLCFASTGPERTAEGIARLHRAVDRLVATGAETHG